MEGIVRLALTLSFCISTTAMAEFRPMIVGGTEAAVGEFPFIVSLQHSSMGHFCGGSLIKKNWVLTAAHCVEGGYIQKVIAGLHDQGDKRNAQVIIPKRIIQHPQYDDRTTDYDFALIELSSDANFDPVALNAEELLIPPAPNQIMATTAGWGETMAQIVTPMNVKPMDMANRLQRVDVPLVSTEVCNDSYRGAITDRMMCAGFETGGKDSCSGDSGGPLVINDATGLRKLVGVVSWGEGCAQPQRYGVYSKVTSVTEWINTTIQ